MHHKFLAAAAFAAALFFLPSPTFASCCDQAPGCCDKAMAACCEHSGHASDINVLELVPIDTQIGATPNARQTFEVWFKNPTWIGKVIVQGRYVIEHDNDRMARGEPCTHIYAYDDHEKPVATFHCTHLERERTNANTVGLITTPDGFKRLTEFQFAGESAGHGYPTVR
jgi:hypothetical protein